MRWIGVWLGLASFVVPAITLGHQDDHADAADFAMMDCEHPPSGALRHLPEPLSHWARILCVPSGQALVQSTEAQWRYPGSWVDKVMLPARTTEDENDARPRYFTRVDVRALPPAEARSQHQSLLKKVSVYADRMTDSKTKQVPQAPKAAWEVIGTNNENKAIRIYLMQHEGTQEMWGLVCAPECESQMSFIVTLLN